MTLYEARFGRVSSRSGKKNNTMDSKYLTVSEVSEYLKLPEETVYKYARTGRMPASKVGRYWRFEQTRIDEWVNQNSNQGQSTLSVVVVDDDPSVRSLLTKWLIQAGCEVTSLSGGENAVQVIDDQSCDLLLLDLMMPAPNGIETLQKLRSKHPDLEIVIVTAFFDSKMMDDALEFGPLTVLKKPVEKEALVSLLTGLTARVR
jgi:two-component system response regulator (stage 0 sporulation protein F)